MDTFVSSCVSKPAAAFGVVISLNMMHLLKVDLSFHGLLSAPSDKAHGQT